MRKFLCVIAIVALAVPAIAQDDLGLGFGGTFTAEDLNALLGGGGNRGGRGNPITNVIPDPDLMTSQLKDLLKSEDVPLDKDQERAIKELLQAERQSIEQLITTQFGNRGNNNRNGSQNNNRTNNFNPASAVSDLEKRIQEHNAALLTQFKGSLTADQVELLKKAEKDKKKVCTVMLDVLDFKRIKEQQNNVDFGPGFGGFGGFGGFDDFGGPGGFGGFGGGRGGRGGRGGIFNNIDLPDRMSCTTRDSTAAERLAPIAAVLSKGKKPLTPDEESRFLGLIQDRMAVLEQELSENPQVVNIIDNLNRNDTNSVNPQQLRNNIVNTIFQNLGIQTAGGNRGGRGGGRGGRGDAGGNPPFNIEADLQQRREVMIDKVIALLNPEQQPVVRKLKYEEIKARGGVERIRGMLEEEGTPLTAEQRSRIQALFDTKDLALRQYAEELVTAEVAKLSTEELTPKPPESENGQNRSPDPNNVSQNPQAQLIVGKLLPQISVRNAVLEKAKMDSVMKMLTPEQVASYKLNSL